jgi:hypothetical protein
MLIQGSQALPQYRQTPVPDGINQTAPASGRLANFCVSVYGYCSKKLAQWNPLSAKPDVAEIPVHVLADLILKNTPLPEVLCPIVADYASGRSIGHSLKKPDAYWNSMPDARLFSKIKDALADVPVPDNREEYCDAIRKAYWAANSEMERVNVKLGALEFSFRCSLEDRHVSEKIVCNLLVDHNADRLFPEM